MNEPSIDNIFILSKIKRLENQQTGVKNPHYRWATHRNIWAGSYDVWGCEQDKIDAVEIPNQRMKAAEEAKLIESEEKDGPGGYKKIIWKLTDLGEEFYEEFHEEFGL